MVAKDDLITDSKAAKTKLIRRTGKKPRKPHRFRPGTVALREIKRYQKTTENLTKRLPVSRIVREIVHDNVRNKEVGRMKSTAIDILQLALEEYAVELFQKAQKFSIHAGRITIAPDDIQLADQMMVEKINSHKTRSK